MADFGMRRGPCPNPGASRCREAFMHDPNISLLTTWENFYVIIGSAAAALTGLMFVAVTLIPEAMKRAAASHM